MSYTFLVRTTDAVPGPKEIKNMQEETRAARQRKKRKRLASSEEREKIEQLRKIREDLLQKKQEARELAEKVNSLHTEPMITVVDERHGEIQVTKHVHDLIEKNNLEACPQRTPEWYLKRNNHVTASLMATICGANPYEKRTAALQKKTGLGKPFTGNAATAHGNKYEMEAILKYEALTNNKCLEFGLLESLNDGEEFLAGSPDGITATGFLIEVKCPYRRKPTNEIPEHYRFQIQFLMHTLRLPFCDFIQYVPEAPMITEIFIVTREKYNPYFWKQHFPALRRFWDDVLDLRKIMEKNTIEQDEDSDSGELTLDDVIGMKNATPSKKKMQVVNISIPGQHKSEPKKRKSKKNAHIEIDLASPSIKRHQPAIVSRPASDYVKKRLEKIQKQNEQELRERVEEVERMKEENTKCDIDL